LAEGDFVDKGRNSSVQLPLFEKRPDQLMPIDIILVLHLVTNQVNIDLIPIKSV